MNKIRIIMICACLLLASLGVGAKSMKDLLVSMPDSLMPYLDKNLRQEMPELQEMGVKAEVKNLLGDNCVMDTLTADFLQIRMSKLSTLQVKKLPAEAGDSLLCVVKTFAGPEKESELYLFDQNWIPQNVSFALKSLNNCKDSLDVGMALNSLATSLLQKPDTMSEEHFLELKKMIEPKMVNAMLLPSEDAIVVRLSLPLLSAEDKQSVNAIKVQRKLKLNGKTFKES